MKLPGYSAAATTISNVTEDGNHIDSIIDHIIMYLQ